MDDTADVLGALEAWLLAEDAYARGGVPDEVLTYLQDHVDHLLGPHATGVAGEHLRQHVGAEGLATLARDRSALGELLTLIEGRRRPGFELEWRAAPVPPAGAVYRPETLLVMTEYGVEDPVWDRPRGRGGPVSLSGLGVSDSLIRRLRAWNETQAGDGWVQQGLLLAHELQRELPDLEVRYFHADDDRPLHG